MGWLKRRIIEDMEPTEYELARRWIPVTERRPDRNIHVIARCRGGQAMEYLYADGLFFRNGEERRVTHWQHFPEPPQDGE